MPDDLRESMAPPPQNPKALKLAPFKNHESAITLYAMFSILKRMRLDLGLEAMIEYMAFYQSLIETHHPHFKSAVDQAIDRVNIQKVYADAMKRGESDETFSL